MRPPIEQIVEIITEIVTTEKILVLGSLNAEHKWQNVFSGESPASKKVIHYNLLVLVIEDENKFDQIQETIENKSRPIVPVTVLIQTISQFNRLLYAGHPFAVKIWKAHCVIFSGGKISFIDPGASDRDWPATIEAEYTLWYNSACSFLTTTEYHQLRKELRLAAFSLHQATELFFMTIIQAVTGFRTNTHNIEKLHRYCRAFFPELSELFPRDNEKEASLFKLLQKAYIDARYSPEYTIKEAELVLLVEQVKKLQAIAEEAKHLKKNTKKTAKK